ncbi:MAG: PDZ domain-containing protein [Terrimicrobiaceae bacterium]|nr:PDZ domain-containing protein [Terrimicrobiaceae bacterium]
MIPRLLLVVFLAGSLHAGTTPTVRPSPTPAVSLAQSVIRVNSTNQSFDFLRPWMKKAPFPRRGLGVVLDGGLVLVTAELVANHNYVELEKAQSAEKSPAEVVRVDYDYNLALLKPADPKFLEDFRPLPLDSGAKVGDSALVLQLEPNGDLAETTAKLTSITTSGYPFEGMALLVFRVSAPLQQRDGSFTVPTVRDGRLLGLLMRYDPRMQTGDVIPPPVIQHFLDEHARPEFGGIPRAGLAFSHTRDPQLRRYLGLNEPGGVLVTDVLRDGAAATAGIKTGDVVLAVNGQAVDQDGNYADPEFGRIPFSHLTNLKAHTADTVTFRIFREGKTFDVPVLLVPRDRSKMLSEPYIMDRAPRFVVLGGLVFQELSRPYLQEWGGNWVQDAPQRLVHYDAFQNEVDPERGRIIFLSQVLPTADTLGYEDLRDLVVTKVNGRTIRSLDDLSAAIKEPVDGFHRVEFEEDPHVLFLDAKSVEQNREALQSQYSLPVLERL